MFVQHFVH
jgi:hypothetical protein